MKHEHTCALSHSDSTFERIGLEEQYMKQKARAMYMRQACDVYQFRLDTNETIYACIHDKKVYVLGLRSEHWKHVKLHVSENGMRYFNYKKQSFFFSV